MGGIAKTSHSDIQDDLHTPYWNPATEEKDEHSPQHIKSGLDERETASVGADIKH